MYLLSVLRCDEEEFWLAAGDKKFIFQHQEECHPVPSQHTPVRSNDPLFLKLLLPTYFCFQKLNRKCPTCGHGFVISFREARTAEEIVRYLESIQIHIIRCKRQ